MRMLVPRVWLWRNLVERKKVLKSRKILEMKMVGAQIKKNTSKQASSRLRKHRALSN